MDKLCCRVDIEEKTKTMHKSGESEGYERLMNDAHDDVADCASPKVHRSGSKLKRANTTGSADMNFITDGNNTRTKSQIVRKNFNVKR